MNSPFSPKGPRAAATRKNDSQPLKEAIEALLRVYKLQTQFDETSVEAHWEEIMGKPIAARTQQVYAKNKKLYLKIDSAPLKKELIMAKQKMIELINKHAGKTIIDEVIFL
jgi:predicted nucleic acid-binding Zn ribbon protein